MSGPSKSSQNSVARVLRMVGQPAHRTQGWLSRRRRLCSIRYASMPRNLLVAVGLLLAAAVAVFTVSFVKAQDSTTVDLVSNANENVHDTIVVNSATPGYATSFTAGGNGGGYTLQEVTIVMGSFGESDDVAVSIHTDDNGRPGSAQHPLTDPTQLPSADAETTTFTAPDNTVLLTNTTYWVVVERTAGSFNISRTDRDGQTGLAGWTIGDRSRSRTSTWGDSTTLAEHLRMTVRGYANTTDTTVPILVRAAVFGGGNIIGLDYNETLDNSDGAQPEIGAFTLTVDGAEARLGTVFIREDFPARFLLVPRKRIFQGQDVKLTYMDPTIGDDAKAIQDKAGNDAASFTNLVLTNNSTRSEVVPTVIATAKGPNSIWLEWTVPPGVDETEITDYKVEFSTDSGLTWSELADYTGDRTSLRYTMHRGLTPETTYTYRISAVIGQFTDSPSGLVLTTTEAQPNTINGLSFTGTAQGRHRADVDLCWTPDGTDLSDLSDFQYGYMYFELDENSAMPWEDDGTFTFVDIGTTKCNGGSGVGLSRSYLSGHEYFVKFRATKDGSPVESNRVTVQVFNPKTTLKSRILGKGFYGRGPDGQLVFPRVPDIVTGSFQIAVGFGYHFPADAATAEVAGLTISDLEATNATLSEPAGGLKYEPFIGYRVVVTPTTLGDDVTLKVKADAVTGKGNTRTNLASETFRHKTAEFSSQRGSGSQETRDSEDKRKSFIPPPLSAPQEVVEPETLVSNFGQSSDTIKSTADGRRLSIKFRTGDAEVPWTMQSVGFQVPGWDKGVTPTVEIRRILPNNGGTYTLATFNNPSAGTGDKFFQAPEHLKLLPNRAYSVVVGSDATEDGGFALRGTRSDDEDDGHADGWSIADEAALHNGQYWAVLPSTAVKLSVTGTPDTSEALSPLTARVEKAPLAHKGGNFTVLVGFSERIITKYQKFQENGFQVSGGQVSKVSRANGWDDLWKVQVKPGGLEPVTLTVLAGRPCASAGSACTKDGRILSESVSLTVPVAPALSVSDASATEGEDDALVFTVTLDKEWSEEVTVKYATSDGTATAGTDYTETRGTLKFAAGESAKTVAVPVAEDTEAEESETLTLTLSKASGARIEDGEGVGTIEENETDP